MKSIILLSKLIAMLSFGTGDKTADVNPVPGNIPTELVGKWLNGSFSMSNWWSYDGKKYLGNPYTRSVAFDFSKSGEAKFFLVIKTNSGYCTTEAFTYLEGSVVIDEAQRSITLVPKKGNYRGFYSCAPGSNFNRPAKPEELKPTTYYWTMETDTNGQKYMVIRFSPGTSEAGSYFKPAQW
jgi:hypothetical protein